MSNSPMIVKLTTHEGVSFYQASKVIFLKASEARGPRLIMSHSGAYVEDLYLEPGAFAEVIFEGKTIQTFPEPIARNPAETPGKTWTMKDLTEKLDPTMAFPVEGGKWAVIYERPAEKTPGAKPTTDDPKNTPGPTPPADEWLIVCQAFDDGKAAKGFKEAMEKNPRARKVRVTPDWSDVFQHWKPGPRGGSMVGRKWLVLWEHLQTLEDYP